MVSPSNGNIAALYRSDGSAATNGGSGEFSGLKLTRGRRTVDLGSGSYFIALLSTSCRKCIDSVPGLNIVDRTMGPETKVVGLCMDEESRIREFEKTTRAEFPIFALGPTTFFKLSGGKVPKYLQIENGRLVRVWEKPPIGSLGSG
jgi:hypothetical protein